MQSTIGYTALNGLMNSRPKTNKEIIFSQEPVNEYLKWKESYSKSAYKSYRVWVERFHNFVGKAPEALKLEDVAEFSNIVRQQYAPKNVQYGMNIVHNYLRFFHEQGRLSLPLYFVRIPRAVANSHHALTGEEYSRMLEVLGKQRPLPIRNICIIRLLNDTGMRVGELSSLNVEDIRADMSAIIGTEKTTKKRRIFWGAETDAILRRYCAFRSKTLKNESALFVGLREDFGRRISTRSIQRMIRTAVMQSGIKTKICPHSFRHGFIHRLAERGVPDAVIALMVGHTTTHTVSDYTKLSRTELEETYRRVFRGD